MFYLTSMEFLADFDKNIFERAIVLLDLAWILGMVGDMEMPWDVKGFAWVWETWEVNSGLLFDWMKVETLRWGMTSLKKRSETIYDLLLVVEKASTNPGNVFTRTRRYLNCLTVGVWVKSSCQSHWGRDPMPRGVHSSLGLLITWCPPGRRPGHSTAQTCLLLLKWFFVESPIMAEFALCGNLEISQEQIHTTTAFPLEQFLAMWQLVCLLVFCSLPLDSGFLALCMKLI